MSSDFFKAEISDIANEMKRIVDRVQELNDMKLEDLEWPSYCDRLNLTDETSDQPDYN